jgi:DNA-binding CsgD family transcriptional regulator/tetratricopeptide (TPR) repeat protein
VRHRRLRGPDQPLSLGLWFLEVERRAGTSALRGRAVELELVRSWLAGSTAGDPRVLLIEGEAGIGKTMLLDLAVEEAAGQGFGVFFGRSDELERARPFGPLVGAFLGATEKGGDQNRVALKRLLEEGAGVSLTRDPGLQFRLVDGFVDLIESVALDRPVMLVLDDLQWADPSTVITINSMTRRLGYLEVALLAATRPVPRTPDLARLLDNLHASGADHIILEPLSEEAVNELTADLVGAEPGSTLASAVAGASGNPLFVTELLGALSQEGGIEIIEGRAEVRDVTVPPSVRLTILRRLAFLGEDAVDLLRHACLLGSSFLIRDLAVVVERPVPHLVRVLEEPIRAGVIEEREGRLCFRHDLIREALYGDLLDDIRTALHREAGRLLAAAGAPTLQVAEQLVLGAQPGDPEAVAWLHEAARSAARQAPSIAVDLLERSLEIAGTSGETPLVILADLILALLWSGRPSDAEARAREVLNLVLPPELEGPFELGLAQALAAQGRYGNLIEEVSRALSSRNLGADYFSQLKAEAANAFLFLGEPEEAETAAQEAVAVGAPVDSEGVGTGLLVLSDSARGRGDHYQALAYAEEAAARSKDRSGVRRGWGPEIFMAMALRGLDRFDEADEVIQRGRRIDERLGRVSYLPVYSYELASGLFSAGRWDEAVSEAETSLALADEVGLRMLRSWPNGVLAMIALHRGDLAEAADRIEQLDDHGDEPGDSATGSPLFALVRALFQEASGDIGAAIAILRIAWEFNLAHGIIIARRALGPSLVRLAMSAGEKELAQVVATAVEEVASHLSVPSLEGAALFCRGLTEGDADVLTRAVDAYRASPRAFDRALASEAAASALAVAGRISESRALFEDVLEELESIGADSDAARVLATMRGFGMGRRRRGGRTRHSFGWGALTPSELEVVRLAAEGLTNPEIGRRLYISPRTVQSHLSHAFRKLDVSSRVELAAEVGRRGGVPRPPATSR